MGSAADQIFQCRTCGTRVYGPEKVQALVSAHLDAVQAQREREQRLLEAEREYLRDQERRRLEELQREADRLELGRKRAEAEILAAAKCAWPPCPNDHTMTSRYCSRKCTVKNAHAREKQRREEAKVR
jgi:hypothetical protein